MTAIAVSTPHLRWADVVRENYDRVLGHAMALTGNRHDAADLAQDVFLRVIRLWQSPAAISVESVLKRMTITMFADRVRRTHAAPEVALEIEGTEPVTPAVDELLLADEFSGDVAHALATMPEDMRITMLLRDVEGYTYEEISSSLGIKLGTVRSRIHRGRALVRQALVRRASAAKAARA